MIGISVLSIMTSFIRLILSDKGCSSATADLSGPEPDSTGSLDEVDVEGKSFPHREQKLTLRNVGEHDRDLDSGSGVDVNRSATAA